MQPTKNVLGAILAIATSATAIGTFLNATYASRQSEKISQLKFQLENEGAQLNRMTRLYDYTAKAIDECALPVRSSAKARMITSLIDAALQDGGSEGELKAALSRALADSKCDAEVVVAAAQVEVQAEAIARQARLDGTASAPLPANRADWANFDIDVFWCETSGPRARTEAERLVGMLLEDPDRRASGKSRTRIRVLTPGRADALSQRPREGHLVYANADPAEQAVARQLKTVADRTLGIRSEIRTSTQDTRYYVSYFVCPASAN